MVLQQRALAQPDGLKDGWHSLRMLLPNLPRYQLHDALWTSGLGGYPAERHGSCKPAGCMEAVGEMAGECGLPHARRSVDEQGNLRLRVFAPGQGVLNSFFTASLQVLAVLAAEITLFRQAVPKQDCFWQTLSTISTRRAALLNSPFSDMKNARSMVTSIAYVD